MALRKDNLDLEQRHAELHDLCQPLTALQCRLEMGRILGQPGSLEEAVDGSLEETRRMFEVIARIRQRLLAEEESSNQAT